MKINEYREILLKASLKALEKSKARIWERYKNKYFKVYESFLYEIYGTYEIEIHKDNENDIRLFIALWNVIDYVCMKIYPYFKLNAA